MHLLTHPRSTVARNDPVPLQIHGLHGHLSELDPPGAAQGSDRIQDMPGFHRPSSRLGQHRGEQEEVLIADERDVDR